MEEDYQDELNEEEWNKENASYSELGDYDFIKYRCEEDFDPELKRDFRGIRRNLQNQQREAEALIDLEQRRAEKAEKDEENWVAIQQLLMDEEGYIQREEDWHIVYYPIIQEQESIEEAEEEWRKIQRQEHEEEEEWRKIQGHVQEEEEWHKVLLQHPFHYCNQSFVIYEEEEEWPIEDEDFEPDKFIYRHTRSKN